MHKNLASVRTFFKKSYRRQLRLEYPQEKAENFSPFFPREFFGDILEEILFHKPKVCLTFECKDGNDFKKQVDFSSIL